MPLPHGNQIIRSDFWLIGLDGHITGPASTFQPVSLSVTVIRLSQNSGELLNRVVFHLAQGIGGFASRRNGTPKQAPKGGLPKSSGLADDCTFCVLL